jgi:hypothetical protein
MFMLSIFQLYLVQVEENLYSFSVEIWDIKKGGLGSPLTILTLQHFGAC